MNYKEKEKEMMEKYDYAIRAIARANKVDMGIGLDMLKANIIQGSNYAYVDIEEFKKDYAELLEVAKKSL